MSLGVTPEAFGGLTVFDALCYFGFVFFFKRFHHHLRKEPDIYFFVLYFDFILLIGSLHSDFVQHSLISMLSVFPIFIYARLADQRTGIES